MKKIISLILTAVLLLSLCGCDLGTTRMEQLCGTWELLVEPDAEDIQNILEDLDFYPEEIALADTEGLAIVKIVEFNEDKTYCFAYDLEASRELALAYFRDFLDTLYENRQDLSKVYGDTVLTLSKEAFLTGYADLFGLATADELVELLADNVFDYDSLSEDLEVGTFRLRLTDMLLKVRGETEEEYLGFTVEGDTLTLIYVDGEEVYTRR